MKKKSSFSPISAVVVFLVIAGAMLSEAGVSDAFLFILLTLGILIVCVITAVRAAKKAKAEKRPEDPRMKTFTKPDAPCIVCEHTGEDHLERDKRNRIRQLDDWLKTGLIDRKEYAVLKDRYERDM